MATKGLGPKQDASKSGWEQSEFPVVCETCLGENPYLRMTKEPFGKECKVCSRPFTVFRWRPGPKARFKKTEVCQTCAQLKNVCQTCLLDLQFGLPVQVRDSALPTVQHIPQSDVHREYFADQAQKKIASGEVDWGKAPPSHVIGKLARTTPYYQRNLPHLCSFFVRGTCSRGTECPYRHEHPPEESDLSHQNIRDRYHGVNDPVAKRILSRAKEAAPVAPADLDITTLYIGNISPFITEQDLRDAFYSFGEIKSINLVPASKCAFVAYTTRQSAEAAVNQLSKSLVIKGAQLRVAWGRGQQNAGGQPTQPRSAGFVYPTMPGAPFMPPVPPPPGMMPTGAAAYQLYPSMNPAAMGSRPENDTNANSSTTTTTTTSTSSSTSSSSSSS